MAQKKLTKKEIVALLLTIKSELAIIFNELGLKQSIVENLENLIEKEFNIDPKSQEIYEIFDK